MCCLIRSFFVTVNSLSLCIHFSVCSIKESPSCIHQHQYLWTRISIVDHAIIWKEIRRKNRYMFLTVKPTFGDVSESEFQMPDLKLMCFFTKQTYLLYKICGQEWTYPEPRSKYSLEHAPQLIIINSRNAHNESFQNNCT